MTDDSRIPQDSDPRVDHSQYDRPLATASENEVVPNCPYCGNVAALVTGEAVYPHRRDLWDLDFYRCEPCDAHVGCHRGTKRPLGRLANLELRVAKIGAHAAFDPFWKGKGWKRGAAYAWLAGRLGIDRSACHIGMFDVEQCQRVVVAVALARAVDAVAGKGEVL